MDNSIDLQDLIITLRNGLPNSFAQERRKWARQIIENDIEISCLISLLKEEIHISSRFLWLLTEVGEIDSDRLFRSLSHLWDFKDQAVPKLFKKAFAKYWHIAGIPEENEGEAIDLLFTWLMDANTLVSTKVYAVYAIFNLTTKYPELKNELKICIDDQWDKNSIGFRACVKKVVKKL